MNGFLVLTPSHNCDPNLAIAAARAGVCGILDLAANRDDHTVIAAIDSLQSHAHNSPGTWGVRIEFQPGDDHLPAFIAERTGDSLPLLVIAGAERTTDDLRAWQHRAAAIAEQVYFEVDDVATALLAQSLGCDGIIVKGHEAGGLVAAESSFLLLQKLAEKLTIPWYIQGGIGPDTAAACLFAGATGVVLREQLWLADEAPFDATTRRQWRALDGSETHPLTDGTTTCRVFARSHRADIEDVERQIANGTPCREAVAAAENQLIPLGQEIAFAASLADEHHTVGRIIAAFRDRVEQNTRSATAQPALGIGSPLAIEHGTTYPILQGPMTRVSDVAPFCESVASAGGLPFIAVALMQPDAIETLLSETAQRLGGRAWGVGMLGFVPAELRKRQFEVVRRFRPPFAIIAGGRPAQAAEFEADGIATYLHVPSPQLLEIFLREGARKFIFEGRECGGHVGPRTSFSLWQSAIDVLLNPTTDIPDPHNVHVVFAGGIHDAHSAAMVNLLAAPLVERGMKVGVLMGTAYLFTTEAVRDGAITAQFQQQALDCTDTVLLESGFGHATRCVGTPFADEFRAIRTELIRSGRSAEEIREQLEVLNIGRLRIASKGVERAEKDQADSSAPPLVHVDESTQRQRGLYMIGQVAGLRDKVVSMAELHEDVATGSAELLTTRRASGVSPLSAHSHTDDRAPRTHRQRREGFFVAGFAKNPDVYSPASEFLANPATNESAAFPVSKPFTTFTHGANAQCSPGARSPSEIAIVGMAGFFPQAADVRTYWQNIVNRVDAITEVPRDRWRAEDFYSEDRQARDRVYSKWGGFLDAVLFDPIRWKIPPNSLNSIDPMQLLALEAAWRALVDARYDRPSAANERTGAVFGVAGSHDVGSAYSFRTMAHHYLPQVTSLDDHTREQVLAELCSLLPEWTEDSFPGFLANVVTGRITNRLDLGGPNFVVDAACAASLAALSVGVQHLRDHSADAMLVGAADGTNNAFAFMSFAKTHALSPRGRSRPFDDSADGIALGECVSAVMLKRREDAERDGDRIYAIIKGIGSSSDGQNRSLTAPHPPGQVRALHRAYADAGLSPATVSLVEAHGTGTAVGDRSEIASLSEVFSNATETTNFAAIGSVKSMIGHTKTAAGMASLIKTALALKHKVLPPSIGVETPQTDVDWQQNPFYINSEARPWIREQTSHPRRAGLSSFGFGGTNFHVVLEESTSDYHAGQMLDDLPRSAEPFFWSRPDRSQLAEALQTVYELLVNEPLPSLDAIAIACRFDEQSRSALPIDASTPVARAGLVATSVNDLRDKLAALLDGVSDDATGDERTGKDWSFSIAAPLAPSEIAFLYPGQGTQHVNMLRELALHHPQLLNVFECANEQLADDLGDLLSRSLFPIPAFTGADEDAQQQRLDDTRLAQPALAVVAQFATKLLGEYGVRPGAVAGHSFGEFAALWAAGSINDHDLLHLAARRGSICASAVESQPGAMLAVFADRTTVESLLSDADADVRIANDNGPRQTILAGPSSDIDRVTTRLTSQGLRFRRLPINAAFHTHWMSDSAAVLAQEVHDIALHPPALPVYSNTTGEAHGQSTKDLATLLARHLCEPVEFRRLIERMHADGARMFVEVGPGRVLTGLVDGILEDRPHERLSLCGSGGDDDMQSFARLLTRLAVLGLPVNLDRWFLHRSRESQSLADLLDRTRARQTVTPLHWWLTPGKAVPAKSQQPPAVTTAAQPEPAFQPTQAIVDDDTTTTIHEPSDPMISSDVSAATPNAATPVTQAMADFQQSMQSWLELQAQQQQASREFLQTQQQVMQGFLGALGAESPALMESVVAAPLQQSSSQTAALDGMTQHGATQQHRTSARATTLTDVAPPKPPIPGIARSSVPQPIVPASTPPQTRTDGEGRPDVPSRGHRTGAASSTNANGSASVTPPSEHHSTTQFEADLLEVVSRRTGYPVEMLDKAVPLEAGLGIDSIKTVEIFSNLKDYHPFFRERGEDDEELLMHFSQMKTLQAIIDFYDSKQVDGSTSADSASGQPDERPAANRSPSVNPAPLAERFELKPVAADVQDAKKKSSPASRCS